MQDLNPNIRPNIKLTVAPKCVNNFRIILVNGSPLCAKKKVQKAEVQIGGPCRGHY